MNATEGSTRTAAVIYGTCEGHTEQVARRLGGRFRAVGIDCIVRSVDDDPDNLDAVDLMVVGASIHSGAYQPAVVDYVARHLDRLTSAPAAFFSVSLTSSTHTPAADAQIQGYLEMFAEQSGWSPHLIGLFGGALAYSQYGFVKKRLVRAIARRNHQGTDLETDDDYTDWDDVDHFAGECAALVAHQKV